MNMPGVHSFREAEKRAIYKAIFRRRDIRSQFKPHPIPNSVLAKILLAAHHAPSVGYMQPWNFIIIKDHETRLRVKRSFEKERLRSARLLKDRIRRTHYLSFKLEGILEAPVNVCVTCDRKRGGNFVIGRTSILDTDIFSTCCAVQNLWLAARAEGLGMGWVSILSNEELRRILRIPKHVLPIAYLCLGYVTHFPKKPELEQLGWRKRLRLPDLIYFEKWGNTDDGINLGHQVYKGT